MSTNLTTRVGNLELSSPIIVGSCPMTGDEIQRISMVSNGAGAIVLPSFYVWRKESQDEYVAELARIVKQTSIPVIANLTTRLINKDWFSLPSKIEQAGAAAIEVSLDICQSDIPDARRHEEQVVWMAEQAKDSIEIPLFLKLTRSFTSISNLAQHIHPFVQGVVMFGRLPEIDIELDSMTISRRWGLTQPGSVVGNIEPLMRIRQNYPQMHLIACGGIGSSEDMIKAMLAGANAVMVTSALYRNGTTVIRALKDGLAKFMSDRGICNVSELQARCPKLENFDAQPECIEYPPVAKDSQSIPEAVVHCDRFGHPAN